MADIPHWSKEDPEQWARICAWLRGEGEGQEPPTKTHPKPRKLQSRREAVRHALKKRATSKS